MNTSLTSGRKAFCKPQALCDCLGWENTKGGLSISKSFPANKMINWKKLFLIPYKALLPSHSQVPSPDLEESLPQENCFLSRLSALPSQGQKWILDEVPSIFTYIPSLKLPYLLSWPYSHLTCSFLHLTQFQSLWNLSLGFFQGVWTSNWTAISQGRRMAAEVNGKFNMHFNRLVVTVKTTQTRSSLAFILVILILSYKKLDRCW